jgi:hypothetical protein
MTAITTPRTQAGQTLDAAWPGSHIDRLDWHERILAIEAEAVAQALAALPAPTDTTLPLDGATLIARERRRQIEVEGYDAEHDSDESHALALAGATYALPADLRDSETLADVPASWPWDAEAWKPTPGDRLRELEKAGALIAAALDAALKELT